MALDQCSAATLYHATPEEGRGPSSYGRTGASTGDFGGPISRAIWVGLGLAPLVLATTGVVMLLSRRAKRAGRAQREVPPVPRLAE